MSDPSEADRQPTPLPGGVRFPTDSEPLYTVGQVAELLGVQAAFLRRLETQDAVSPARSTGGQRRYTRDEVEHIAAISGLIADGMTLAGAKRILALQEEVADLRSQLDTQGSREADGQP